MINQDYLRSAARLKQVEAEKLRVPSDLAPDRVSTKQLTQIAAYALTKLQKSSEKLSSNQAHREKHDPSMKTLPRTVVVCRATDGEYFTFIDTKSKKNTVNKVVTNGKSEGARKRGKICYRLDDKNGIKKYFSLVKTLQPMETAPNGMTMLPTFDPKSKQLLHLAKEVNFAQKINHPNFNRPVLGPVYFNDKGFQQAIYSEYGTNLFEAIQKKELSLEDCDSIAVQLCEAIAHAHRQGYILQDLKPENVLINKDQNGKIAVRLIDFESVVGNEFKGNLFWTPGCESPEIAFATNPDEQSLGTKSIQKLFIANKENIQLLQELKAMYRSPDAANDVWSLGVMLFVLYKGRMPRDFADVQSMRRFDLSPLLEPLRAKRATAERALEILKNSITSAEPVETKHNIDKSQPATSSSVPLIFNMGTIDHQAERRYRQAVIKNRQRKQQKEVQKQRSNCVQLKVDTQHACKRARNF